MTDDALGNAAEEEPIETPAAVRPDDDEIGGPGGRVVDDLVPRIAGVDETSALESRLPEQECRLSHQALHDLCPTLVQRQDLGGGGRRLGKRQRCRQILGPFVDGEDMDFRASSLELLQHRVHCRL